MITWWLVSRGNYQGSNQFIDDKSYQERVKYVKSLIDLQLKHNSQSDKSKSHPNMLLNL